MMRIESTFSVPYPALEMRGFMITYHQMHDFLPWCGPNSNGLDYILERMRAARLNTLLVEYECMFPWSGRRSVISAGSAFSEEQIRSFNTGAAARGISIIPLVQVLGHVYHILIHSEFQDCAEKIEVPQQFCPLSPATRKLVCELIDDTIRLHPDSPYIHLGGDECEQLGICPECAAFAREHGSGKLFIDFMRFATDYAISRGKTPIIWHDVALRTPQFIPELDSRVLFHFWNYGDSSHGSLPGELEKLLRVVSADRIIGGPGARAEKQHGMLHHSPSLVTANIREMNSHMVEIGAAGSILTDWSDTGCFYFDSFFALAYQGVSAWEGKAFSNVRFRSSYARETFGFDGPELPDKLDAISGATAFARGFQFRQKTPLNRYARAAYDFKVELELVRRDYESADGETELYRLVGRCEAAKNFLEWLDFHRADVRTNSSEYEYTALLAELTVMFLEIDIGIRKDFFMRRYFSEISAETVKRWQSLDYLSRALERWPRLRRKFSDFAANFVPGPLLENYLAELFQDTLFSSLCTVVNH